MTFNLHIAESLRPWDIIQGGIGSKEYTNVYRIMTRSALLQALRISTKTSIRGLFKDGWVFVWDGWYATHNDFRKQFGAGSINFEIEGGKLKFYTPEQYKAAFDYPVLKNVLGEYLK